MAEKAGDIETKANLQRQPSFNVRDIDSKCAKDKKNIYWEFRDEVSKDKDKVKSYIQTSANQPQTQAVKKNKRAC